MSDLATALQERSRQQSEMTAIILKITAEACRYSAIETLGKVNEKEALQAALQHLTTATLTEIERAIQEVETIKGKKYLGEQPYAGIADTLHQGGITKAELNEWLTAVKRTTFNSGHRYQPLPSHDEAWQTYCKVHSELHHKKQAAETIRYRPPITISNDELIQAATWGFWDELSANLRRRLYLLLPAEKKQAIKNSSMSPQQAMYATRCHYDKMIEPSK